MLPNNPLLYLIAKECNKPLVTTSGNISGSPILYKDEDALTHLFDIADLILTYDREIVMPQDDSVIQLTETGQKIILRRSRGLAPGYFPNPFSSTKTSLMAFGGELKGAFAIHQNGNIYISQYLGDQQSLESQNAYKKSMSQLTGMLHIKPDVILADSHPGYHTSLAASAYNIEHNVENLLKIQHHKAHFSAVLAENSILNNVEPILGIVWDGTGFGDDHQIWGSEVFLYENGDMRRLAHLKYFNHLMNDKMSREPRLSALSLLKELPAHQHIIETYFNETEWKYYQKVLTGKPEAMTSSMGRFLDGIACILGCKGPSTYNACGVMKWNEGTSFPIQSGHPCIGCSEENYWDNGRLYERASSFAGFGIEADADNWGKVALGVTAAAIAGHAIATNVSKYKKIHELELEGKEGEKEVVS